MIVSGYRTQWKSPVRMMTSSPNDLNSSKMFTTPTSNAHPICRCLYQVAIYSVDSKDITIREGTPKSDPYSYSDILFFSFFCTSLVLSIHHNKMTYHQTMYPYSLSNKPSHLSVFVPRCCLLRRQQSHYLNKD